MRLKRQVVKIVFSGLLENQANLRTRVGPVLDLAAGCRVIPILPAAHLVVVDRPTGTVKHPRQAIGHRSRPEWSASSASSRVASALVRDAHREGADLSCLLVVADPIESCR
jgi:hypothetical protein